ncbi:MAG TPA: nitroreductase family protein [Polyangia bacterium]
MPHVPDQVLELLRGRRSVRRFRPEPVPAAMLDEVLEAARWAPTAGNRQSFRLLVVTAAPVIAAMGAAVRAETARLRAALRPEMAGQVGAYLGSFEHFTGAPAVVVTIYRPGLDLLAAATGVAGASDRPERDALASAAAVTTYLLLAAHAAGLGTCWMTGPCVAAEALREVLQVPAGWSIAALVPVGFPAEAPAAPPRRPLAQLVLRRGPTSEGDGGGA